MIYNGLIILCFLSVFWIMKKINKNLYVPSMLFTFYWMTNIVVGIMLFGYDYQWVSFSLYYIFFMCIIFFVVESFFWRNKRDIPEKKKMELIYKVNDRKVLIRSVLVFTMVMGFIYVYTLLINHGHNLTAFYSLENLINTSHTYTVMRYGGGEENSTILGQIMLSTTYFGWLFSGFIYPFTLKRKDRTTGIFCFLILLPTILMVLVSNGKTSLVFGLILWATGYLLSNQFVNIKINFALIKKIILLITVAFVVFAMAFYIRYGGAEFSKINNRIITYGIGHVPAFDEWFGGYHITWFGETYGSSTFNAIFRFLGLPIINENSANFVTETKYGITNVHTLFSNVLLDFGIIGSFIFFILLGGVSGLLLTVLRRKKISALNITSIGLLYFCILYSFLISPLKYTSLIFALIEFYLVLKYVLSNKIIKIRIR